MTIKNFVFLLYFNGMLTIVMTLYYWFIKQFSMGFVVCICVKYLVFMIEYY